MRQSSWSNLAAAKMVQVYFPAPVEYRCPAFSRAASHHGFRGRPFLLAVTTDEHYRSITSLGQID
jgi:hypothetical protein